MVHIEQGISKCQNGRFKRRGAEDAEVRKGFEIRSDLLD